MPKGQESVRTDLSQDNGGRSHTCLADAGIFVPEGETFVMPIASFSNAFSLITFIPGLSVSVRRLHDINRTGWWLLIVLTIIGLVMITSWACIRSAEGDNQYGASPLATE